MVVMATWARRSCTARRRRGLCAGQRGGRPLINSVGKPGGINGTCLDFLAESFMAGDPNHGGGFVILNGVKFDERRETVPLPSRIRAATVLAGLGRRNFCPRPAKDDVDQQLNGGKFAA